MTASIYEFPSRRRVDHLSLVPDELDDAAREYYWNRLERLERAAEQIRRILNLLPPELGVEEQDN